MSDSKSSLFNTPEEVRLEYNELVRQMSYYDYWYYEKDDSKITDEEYDRIKNRILQIVKEYPEIASKKGVTKIGAPAAEGFKKVRHAVPMLSLSNAFTQEDIEDFIGKIRRFLGLSDDTQVELVAEPKIDGLSCSLRYEYGKLVQAEEPADFSDEIFDILLCESIGEGEHRHGVADFLEAARGRGADGLRGAVRGYEIGVSGFEFFQLLPQGVIFGVGHNRRVVGVIGLVVAADLRHQLGVAGSCIFVCFFFIRTHFFWIPAFAGML